MDTVRVVLLIPSY